MSPRTPTPEATGPKGYLTFKAIRRTDGDRVTYVGTMPVFNLIDQRFIEPVASDGLAPDILKATSTNGPVQRRTSPAHVQAIVDYIVEQAEKGEPWAFNSVVLYSTSKLEFEGVSIGMDSAGEARATDPFSVGEGLHRSLAWAVALNLANVKGVKRPDMTEQARKRVEQATIPVVVIEEKSLRRQKTDFHRLNQQKPLTSTVLNLTDDTVLSDLTRLVIADVGLFRGRIDINNASVGAKSDKLLSFSQLRFVVASYLLGKKTRSTKGIEHAIDDIVARRGAVVVRKELSIVFSAAAMKLGGLERLHLGRLPSAQAGEFVRELRANTLLASNAAWRALFVALHEAKKAGVDADLALDRLTKHTGFSWARNGKFFVGTLIDRDTAKLLSSRESIDAAAEKLVRIMKAS
jgi:DGQHR domain-containing protein